MSGDKSVPNVTPNKSNPKNVTPWSALHREEVAGNEKPSKYYKRYGIPGDSRNTQGWKERKMKYKISFHFKASQIGVRSQNSKGICALH